LFVWVVEAKQTFRFRTVLVWIFFSFKLKSSYTGRWINSPY